MIDVIKDLKNKITLSKNRIPSKTLVSCEECGWHGSIEKCPLILESEGRYLSYTILVCPVCGKSIDV